MAKPRGKSKLFKLPDLGEGLQEAELVEWHVAEGDEVTADQPLVSMETDKAIVEVPSPRSGGIARLHGSPGDIIPVGAVLVEFAHGDVEETKETKQDAGTVVGAVQAGDQVVKEEAITVGQVKIGVKATPAVRALAKRLNVDLAVVTPSGADGLVTAADVERVSEVLVELGPIEQLRGPRRAMARKMTQARAEVVPVTVSDDADAGDWGADADVTLRLIRAIVAGCRAEPALNAWYDSHAVGRRVLKKIHLGVAVDTDEGLFVPVLHDIGNRSMEEIKQGLDQLKADVRARTIPPQEMRGYTFTLSNFGSIFGRYANPIVQPPTVGILGAGAMRPQVVALDGKPQVRRTIPLSLTFDHRTVTGGEASRFLKAVVEDLRKAT